MLFALNRYSGGGALFKPSSEREHRVAKALEVVRKRVGAPSISCIAIAWILMHPCKPDVVVAPTSKERLDECIAALSVNLTRDDYFTILEASCGHEVA